MTTYIISYFPNIFWPIRWFHSCMVGMKNYANYYYRTWRPRHDRWKAELHILLTLTVKSCKGRMHALLTDTAALERVNATTVGWVIIRRSTEMGVNFDHVSGFIFDIGHLVTEISLSRKCRTQPFCTCY